jgi:hypothetical protein
VPTQTWNKDLRRYEWDFCSVLKGKKQVVVNTGWVVQLRVKDVLAVLGSRPTGDELFVVQSILSTRPSGTPELFVAELRRSAMLQMQPVSVKDVMRLATPEERETAAKIIAERLVAQAQEARQAACASTPAVPTAGEQTGTVPSSPHTPQLRSRSTPRTAHAQLPSSPAWADLKRRKAHGDGKEAAPATQSAARRGQGLAQFAVDARDVSGANGLQQRPAEAGPVAMSDDYSVPDYEARLTACALVPCNHSRC